MQSALRERNFWNKGFSFFICFLLRQQDFSLKEELKPSTKISLLSINSIVWARERHHRWLKPVQDDVVAKRPKPVPGYVFPPPLLCLGWWCCCRTLCQMSWQVWPDINLCCLVCCVRFWCAPLPEPSEPHHGTAVELLTPTQGGGRSTRVERADPALLGQHALTSA